MTTPKVRIEILHGRDPDSSCDFDVWVDGKRITWNDKGDVDLTVEDIDPGAGYQLSDWRESSWLTAQSDATPEFKALVLQARKDAESSSYIEDDLETDVLAIEVRPTDKADLPWSVWLVRDDDDNDVWEADVATREEADAAAECLAYTYSVEIKKEN